MLFLENSRVGRLRFAKKELSESERRKQLTYGNLWCRRSESLQYTQGKLTDTMFAPYLVSRQDLNTDAPLVPLYYNVFNIQFSYEVRYNSVLSSCWQ